MTVVLGGLTPHPPALIPEIGSKDRAALERTAQAMRELARMVAAETPDVVIIATPHSPGNHDRFGVYGRDWQLGDFAHQGASNVTIDAPGDPLLAAAIVKEARAMGLEVDLADGERSVPLDYGIGVPLYYLQHAGYQGAVLPVTIARQDRDAHRRFGQAIARAASVLGKRTVLLASGDLSHRERAREAKVGRRFDQQVLRHLENGDWKMIYGMDPTTVEQADECGFNTLLILLGALENSLPKASLLAYEDGQGVGYATVSITVDDSAEQDVAFDPAGFARQVADTFLQTDRLPPAPEHFPHESRGCFVCLHRQGMLVACAGAMVPKEGSLASEIARHTLTALHDYAEVMAPDHGISIDDLHHMTFTVYFPGELEAIDGPEQVREGDGVLVTHGDDYGMALPGATGEKTPAQLLETAIERAGFAPGDSYRIERFSAERFAELATPAW